MSTSYSIEPGRNVYRNGQPFAYVNCAVGATPAEVDAFTRDIVRMRVALEQIAEWYTDDLGAKHMRAMARAALTPTGNSADYVSPESSKEKE